MINSITELKHLSIYLAPVRCPAARWLWWQFKLSNNEEDHEHEHEHGTLLISQSTGSLAKVDEGNVEAFGDNLGNGDFLEAQFVLSDDGEPSLSKAMVKLNCQ